ncbi:MAG: T9SS type A sorting domain-containing protein [Bacteroidota bacterium]
MKLFIILLGFLITLPQPDLFSQVFLYEGFENGQKPEGWTEEYVVGAVDWRYRNGGYNPSDPNLDNPITPNGEVDIARNPPAAYEGNYNAFFFNQGVDNERTKLITPELNMMGATAVELRFYLCQIPWTFEGSIGWDILRVYYKVSETDPWVLIHEYLDPIYAWEKQILNLPNPSETYYVAFEGHARWGFGTLVDSVHIEDIGAQQLYVENIVFEQPFSLDVPSGSSDVPVLRTDVKVYGNTGTLTLDQITFTSLNSSDADISTNGVKLYSTSTQIFSTDNPVGASTSISGGEATFTALNHNLSPGHNYLWLAYDVALDATHKNRLDAMVQANQIVTSNGTFPATDQSPLGDRTIYHTQYKDDFEGSLNWTLTGEFQVGTPVGNGGDPGNPNPVGAYSGVNALGTDLSGLGANPYNYEPNLTEGTADMATSGSLNTLYYKDLNLFFNRHLNIEVWDRAAIEISTDDGANWEPIWESNAYINDFQWNQQKVAIPGQYWRSEQLRLRFSMGPTNGVNNYSGWNIDDVYLTGEFISKDVGVSEWISPQSGSGHTSSESVTIRIRNYGGAAITDPVPVAYSFNGGSSWTIDQMDTDIPVDGSVDFTFPTRADLSQPGLRPSVIAKTVLPGDQYIGNDHLTTEIYIVPTYAPPYQVDFEDNDGYWRSHGNIWEFGAPAGATINSAASGSHSWATGISYTYGDMISDPYQVIFEDGFETDMGWTFTGEFELANPHTEHLPWYAFFGYYCIGTDLGGHGTNLYQYENGITTASAYTATSPPLDVSEYSNLELSFSSWITTQGGDSIRLEVSDDNGSTWHTIWQNLGTEIMDTWWQDFLYAIPDELTFTDLFRIRFSFYYSSPSGAVAQGWSIDNILLSGDLVHTAQGHLSSPSFDLTGIQNPMIAANLWIETEEGTDGANLQYSLDDGANWTTIANASGNDSYWNWYTGQPVTALGNNGWSSHSNQWIPVKHLLPASLAGQSNVQLRFTFAADKADNQYDGIAVDDVRVMEAPHDADLLAIVDPVSSCELNVDQRFTLTLRNSGPATIQAGDSVRIGYHIDHPEGIQTAEEVYYLTQNLPVGNTLDITTGSEFDFSYSGEYLATVYLQCSDPHFYTTPSADTVSGVILVNKPHVDLGDDISTVKPDTILLKAFSGVGGQTYLWHDGSTDSTFQVSTDGTYYVRVSNGIGCIASDTVQVLQLVADVGVSAYLGPQSACELENQLPLEVTIANMGTDTVEVGETIFIGGIINVTDTFEDTIVITQRFKPGESFDYTYSGLFNFSTPNDYQMKLYTRMNKDMSDANDTLYHTLQVFGYPDANLGPDTVVLASEYTLTPAPGYFEYLWQDESTGETFTVTEPALGLYHVEVSDVNQCTSRDTVIVSLNVLDLALDELLAPSTSCELSESIIVTARVRNTGNKAIPSGETINMGYLIDGGPLEQDALVLTENLLPGHFIDFAFSKTESVETGQWYDFTVFVDYTEDSKSWNDTIIQSVGVFETPAIDLGEEYQVITDVQHTLDAGPGFVSYLWHDGSTNQTFIISEPGIGLYGVTVTDANGCTVYDETEILLAVPDIGVKELTYPQTNCRIEPSENVQVAIQNFGNWDIEPGASIWVAYSINGGDAVLENVVLDSTFENGAVIYHTFAQVEDFSEPGRYEIMAYTIYASDLIPSNNIVLVNVDHFGSPQIDIGNGQDTIQVFEPITLSATPGYPSYLWQDGSTNLDYPITVPSEGMYSVVVTADNGCVTADSVYVSYDVPDIEIARIVSPVSSCGFGQDHPVSIEIVNNGYFRISAADTLTIAYSVNSGSTFNEAIHLDTDLLAKDTTILTFADGYDFSAIGTYQIQASILWSLDEYLSNNILITNVHSWDPVVVEIGGGEDTMKTSLPVTLDAGTGFVAYLWQDNSTGSTYEVTEAGLYWVMVTNENGCSASDSVYVDSGTSAEEWASQTGQVRIYPNPVKEVLNVAFELDVEQGVILEMYTIANSLVYREDIKHAQVEEARIDVSNLTPGTYFLKITTDDIPHNFLVIVE